MDKVIITRVLEEANYIIKTNYTLRQIAKEFNVSKSTVHKDLKERLKLIDLSLHKEVKNILKNHKDTRHIKGGESTKKKYLKLHL